VSSIIFLVEIVIRLLLQLLVAVVPLPVAIAPPQPVLQPAWTLPVPLRFVVAPLPETAVSVAAHMVSSRTDQRMH
jgi:hypothetical protein